MSWGGRMVRSLGLILALSASSASAADPEFHFTGIERTSEIHNFGYSVLQHLHGVDERPDMSRCRVSEYLKRLSDPSQWPGHYRLVNGAKGPGSRYILKPDGKGGWNIFGSFDEVHVDGEGHDRYKHNHSFRRPKAYKLGDIRPKTDEITSYCKPNKTGRPNLIFNDGTPPSLSSQENLRLRLAHMSTWGSRAPDFRPSFPPVTFQCVLPGSDILMAIAMKENPEIAEYCNDMLNQFDHSIEIETICGLKHPSEIVLDAEQWSRRELPYFGTFMDYYDYFGGYLGRVRSVTSELIDNIADVYLYGETCPGCGT